MVLWIERYNLDRCVSRKQEEISDEASGMPDDANPKRSWFRFHLLTAVLMTLGVGGALSLNIRSYVDTALSPTSSAQGWPLPAFETMNPTDHINWTAEQWELYFTPQYNLRGVVVDIITALLIVLVIGRICEYLLRHRGGCKT